METNAERRRRKLIEVCRDHGGEARVAELAGLNADALKQIVRGYKSSHPPKSGIDAPSTRGLGDTAARAIERALTLERGWFDNDGDTMMTPQEVELVGIFRQLNEPAKAVVMDTLRAARDEMQRQAERIAEGLRAPATPKL